MLRRILNQATRAGSTRRRGHRPGAGAGPGAAAGGSAGKTRGAGSLLRGLSKRRRGI